MWITGSNPIGEQSALIAVIDQMNAMALLKLSISQTQQSLDS